MRELAIEEINTIAGAECTLNGPGQSAVSVGIAGAVAGMATGTMTLPVFGTVAGWVGGGILGTVGGAAGYAGTCWWNNNTQN
ncbi:bacteriocin [Raoultella terrigena]|uniref:bacteriocin n=1 Tax=Raoultella terrigena TaxID=577 RepID=UPI0010083DEA